MSLPVPLKTYRSVVKQCLKEVKSPVGTRSRRRARKRRGARDAALFTLAYTCGVKSSELVSLKTKRCTIGNFGSGTVTLSERPSRRQTLHLTGPTYHLLRLWLKHHDGSSYLFYPISNWGNKYNPPITQNGIRAIVKKRHNQIPSEVQMSKNPTFQKLRSSFKQLLKGRGVKDAIIRDLMGLSSRRTAPRDHDKADKKMNEALEGIAHRAGQNMNLPPI